MTDVIYRKPDIERVTGMSERQLRRMEADGNFPKRLTLTPGGRAVGWRASEIQAWIESRG